MLTAAVSRGPVRKADGSAFEPYEFNPWADEPVLTLEQAMKQWT